MKMRMYVNRFLTQSRKGAEKRRGLSFLLCATLRLCVSALIFSAPTAFGQSITATKAYVDRKYTEATNAVAIIVTAEDVAWELSADADVDLSGWKVEKSYIYNISAGIKRDMWALVVPDLFSAVKKQFAYELEELVTEVTEFRRVADGFEPVRTFTVRATRTDCNALGLARMKDIEKLPDHETVSNVARAVSNSFWDEKNEVLWRLEFRDGEPMFVPVTNENVKVSGGVL